MLKWNETRFDNIQCDTVKKRGGKIEYLNIEAGFDIETTSYMDSNENRIPFMYEWTFGIKDKEHICYGRTWEEFLTLCRVLQKVFDLSENRALVVYIHNFSFEFQFMRKYFTWLNTFSVDERKPVKALCSYGIEFRDSYILSGYSLANTAKNLQFHDVKKLQGELDYSLIRHSGTSMTDEELAYCNNDVEIILAYINEQIKQYGNIVNIPLTNTGRVRRYVRQKCYNGENRKARKRAGFKYHKIMKDLTISGEEEYNMLKKAFQGGFTHANHNYVGKVLSDVSSIDFTSSYPAVMLSEKFPMSKGEKISTGEIKREFPDSKEPWEDFCKKYLSIFKIHFVGLKSIFFQENYLSESKCLELSNDAIVNNGRVVSASEVTTVMTNVDWQIFKRCYSWDKMAISNVYRYKMGYLPKQIILAVLQLYQDKTTLKDVEGKEVEYLLSKGMLNSVYGMSVTDIVHDEILYEDETDLWDTQAADTEEQIDKYNKSWNRFLYYPWGVFITAYARKNLWNGILHFGTDYVYSDTDSIKCLNYDLHKEWVQAYNEDCITKKLHMMCDYWKIDKSLLTPKTIEGKEKPIGVWDFEGTYKHFKTLGAKRYLVEEQDGNMKLTVAGLGKSDGIEYIVEQGYGKWEKVFDFFNDDMYIPEMRTGKNTHFYVDEEITAEVKDYQGHVQQVTTRSGVFLAPCEFTLSISKQFGKFLKMVREGFIYMGVEEVG